MRLDPQITGNVGLYYCCYRLSLLGWNVMPTTRNARGVDIIIYSKDASRFHGIQVKALSKRAPVPLGKTLDRCTGDFWIIIHKVAGTTPGASVMLPDEVRNSAHRGEKDGRVSYWLQPQSYDRSPFKDAWERIGRGDAPSELECADMSERRFPSAVRLVAFEGGAVYTAEEGGKYFVVTDETAALEMLDEGDREGIDATKVRQFDSAASRDEYIAMRGWPPIRNH